MKSWRCGLFKYADYLYNDMEIIWRTRSVIESEVMHMEQVRYFLAEYSGWISMAVSGLTLLLLAAALHRIKKIGKQIKETALDVKAVLEFARRSAETEKVRMAAEQQQSGKKGAERQMISGQASGDMPDELLDAVLEEVFP